MVEPNLKFRPSKRWHIRWAQSNGWRTGNVCRDAVQQTTSTRKTAVVSLKSSEPAMEGHFNTSLLADYFLPPSWCSLLVDVPHRKSWIAWTCLAGQCVPLPPEGQVDQIIEQAL